MISLGKLKIGEIKLTDRISFYDIFYICITIRYLLPAFFAETLALYYPLLDNFLLLLSLAVMGMMIIRSRHAVHPLILLFCLPCMILVFSTIINHGDLQSAIVRTITALLFCMITGDAISDGEKTYSFLHVIRNITWIFFIANLIAMAAGIKGEIALTDRPALPLYGNINSVIRQIFPGLCCSCIIDSKNNRKLSFITISFFMGAFYCFAKVYFSATSFAILMFIIVWILAQKIIRKNVKGIYILFLLFAFCFEIIFVIVQNPSVMDWISKLFHRPAQFDGRGPLWRRAWNSFLEKPVFGCGYQNLEIIENVIGNLNGSHNYFLDLLYQRGITGLLSSLVIFLFPAIVMRNGNKVPDSAYILTGFCCAFILMFLIEVFTQEYYIYPVFYALILLSKGLNQH